MMKSTILFLALVLSSAQAFANPKLKALFSQTFLTHYQAGRCGDNIMGLLKSADAAGINIANAEILEITNEGFSVFGMVNVEFARASGRLNPSYPASGMRNLPGERNWYHHVVLEMDGLIYDFDFGNEPQVVSVNDYFEKMFLNEKRKDEGGEFYVGRDDKLKTYELLIRPGLETLRARENRERSPEKETLRLGNYLNR